MHFLEFHIVLLKLATYRNEKTEVVFMVEWYSNSITKGWIPS